MSDNYYTEREYQELQEKVEEELRPIKYRFSPTITLN